MTEAAAQRAGLESASGAIVTRVTPGGPAAAAGLRAGDVVVSFNGRAVADSRALTRMVGEAEIGASAPVEIMRDGQLLSLSANIQRLEETESGPRVVAGAESAPRRRDSGPRSGRIFGIALAELDASLREEFQIEPEVRGLVVLGGDIGGENEGVLRTGDVIEAMGFQPVDTIAATRAVAGEAAIGERALVVRINRGGAITYRRLRARS